MSRDVLAPIWPEWTPTELWLHPLLQCVEALQNLQSKLCPQWKREQYRPLIFSLVYWKSRPLLLHRRSFLHPVESSNICEMVCYSGKVYWLKTNQDLPELALHNFSLALLLKGRTQGWNQVRVVWSVSLRKTQNFQRSALYLRIRSRSSCIQLFWCNPCIAFALSRVVHS